MYAWHVTCTLAGEFHHGAFLGSYR